MQLEILNQFSVIKQGDTKNEFKFKLLDYSNVAIDLTDKTVSVIVANSIGKILEKTPIKDADPTSGIILFSFDNTDVTGYGDMFLEVHVTDLAGDKQIIPSDGYYKFVINRNLNDASTGVTNYSLQYFTDQFNAKINEFNSKMGEIDSAIDTANQSAINTDAKAIELEERVNNAIATTTNSAEIIDARGTYSTLNNRLESLSNQVVETFTSTENQSIFILTNTYDITKTVECIVGGVPQYSPENFTKTNSTTITISEGIPAGVNVVIIYAKTN